MNAYATLPIAAGEREKAAGDALSRSEPYDLTDAVITHVERQAARHPERPAIEEAGGIVGYAALVTEARAAAAALAALGVSAGQVVAVGGARGVDVITTFLALELLGAVYMPVDAAWPAGRIEDVLTDSRAVLLVVTGTPEEWESLLKGAEAAGCPAGPLSPAEGASSAGRPMPPEPDEIRYVIYTSGSTGRPKGALVEHQGMLNHLWAKVQDLRLDQGDRLAQTAPLGFDISVWQMLAPLLVGGTVQIYTDDEARDGAALLSRVQSRGTTVLEIVPTLILFLLEALDTAAADLGALRWMIATGEELPPALARRWISALPGIALLNAYGPTECSDDVTHAVVAFPAEDVRHLPIGGPIGNVTLYVLRRVDGGWEACPAGEAGELFVGGVAVGRGYLGDPGRTAAAFYQDPFTGHGRLYRTGDSVRVLPSGELEYLGRVDRQVKIGGVRMELAEIEAVLRDHPAVDSCAVTVVDPGHDRALVARESSLAPGSAAPARLVAYVAPAGPPGLREELHRHLSARLPQPMVPQDFVELPRLPLTRNGKIDYAGLPAPPRRERPAGRPLAPPAGAAEQGIAEVVGQILDVGAVGRGDRFLELGGDSLLAMRLLSRLRSAGSTATLRDVLRDGSPAALATFGWRPVAVPAAAAPAPEGAGPRTRPLTPQQAGVYFHWRLDPDSPYYSYQGSLVLDGPLDHDRLARAWKVLLRENPLLLARFAEEDGEPVHRYPHWQVPLRAAEDLSGLDHADRGRIYRDLATAEAARPFDLTGAPALRAGLFTFGAREHRLLVTMHEILLDGWGATVLFQRLAELYESSAGDEAAPDPERATRYDRYLDWHADLLETPEVAAAGTYWRDRLAGDLPVLDIARKPRPTRPTYRGEIVEAVLDRNRADRLRAAATRSGSTPFVLFLAAYALALTYYADADEVVVGAPMANRERPEQADVPAFMLAMLPLRIRIDADMTLGSFAGTVRDLVLDAYTAADHPFGWTLRGLPAASRSGATTPVFQTMLNMLPYPARDTAADGVSFRFVELDTGYTKYDCALYVQPHGPLELLVQFSYQRELLDAGAAHEVLESTFAALRALTDSPGTLIRALDLLPPIGD